jgi:beta-mannosidase
VARVEVTGQRRRPLGAGWEMTPVAPGTARDPKELETIEAAWQPAAVPGTVAATLHAAGRWDLGAPANFEATDWWYRCHFTGTSAEEGVPTFLGLDGLATVSDVWLNGSAVLHADNMFRAHEVDVTEFVREQNTLLIRFHALQPLLDAKRPRPRWRTRLVDHQQLRWVRTTLLGRIPGWSPPVQTVGPWRPVWLEERPQLSVEAVDVRTRVEAADGVVEAAFRLRVPGGQAPASAALVVGDRAGPLACSVEGGRVLLHGTLRVPGARLWWPHTHGPQPLYEARLRLLLPGGWVELACGRIGFRTIDLRAGTDGAFEFRVNGVPVFCRGACWTPVDLLSLTGPPSVYRSALEAARHAGMNMLRVSGATVYEADTFYDLCDELGILVWQDFMFASMDYPVEDPVFATGALAEAEETVERLQLHPSLALFCGNSEVEQQAAMLGLPRELWRDRFFGDELPEVCRRRRPDVPYWPSTPSGGTLPFQVNAGVAHYYGVGAYLRPAEDARRSDVRFAAECLGFANVPGAQALERAFGPGESVVHHPRWKARVPRDSGAGWDFEDVRDHYVERLYAVDPLKLRYSDMERYLALSRLGTGEVMASVFAEWRRRQSTCRGGLVWFFRDLRPGAGWGLLDASGSPKAAYYYVRRVFLPITVFFTDEGLNGLALHAINDTGRDLEVELRVDLYRHGQVRIAGGATTVTLPARDQVELEVSALLETFLDVTYAYRFGPAGHDLVVGTMRPAGGGESLGEAFYFPLGLPSTRETDLGVEATARRRPGGSYLLAVRTRRFAQSVAIEVDDYQPDDNYFHLGPGSERVVLLRPIGPGPRRLRGTVLPANAYDPATIRVEP